jgi:hypothetical protein
MLGDNLSDRVRLTNWHLIKWHVVVHRSEESPAEIVHHNNALTPSAKLVDNHATNEPCASGDEDAHRERFPSIESDVSGEVSLRSAVTSQRTTLYPFFIAWVTRGGGVRQ